MTYLSLYSAFIAVACNVDKKDKWKKMPTCAADKSIKLNDFVKVFNDIQGRLEIAEAQGQKRNTRLPVSSPSRKIGGLRINSKSLLVVFYEAPRQEALGVTKPLDLEVPGRFAPLSPYRWF